MVGGVAATDFTSFALNDLGVALTYYAPTLTYDNETGKQTVSLATGAVVTGIFLRREQMHKLDKEGFVEHGDAFLMTATSVTLERQGRITYQGVTYHIEDSIIRYFGALAMHKFTRLFVTA